MRGGFLFCVAICAVVVATGASAENVPLRAIESSQALQVVHLPGRYAVTAGSKLFIGVRRGRNLTVMFDWNTGRVTKVDIPGNSRLLRKVGGNLIFERRKTPSNP